MENKIIAERDKAVRLFEAYGKELSPAQREMFQDHFLYDLSFSEIAESRGISKAGVADAIKKALRRLEELEANIGLLALKDGLRQAVREGESLEDPEARYLELRKSIDGI